MWREVDEEIFSLHTSMERTLHISSYVGAKRKKIFGFCIHFPYISLHEAANEARHTIYILKRKGKSVPAMSLRHSFCQDNDSSRATSLSSAPFVTISLAHTSYSLLFSHSHPIKNEIKNAKKEIENG
jgi:hypothetical protein